MDLRYRIRKRTTRGKDQFFVDYKRIESADEDINNIPWMGGFYCTTVEEAKKIIEEHREYEELRMRLQIDEDIIYDETEEKA